MPYVDHVVVAVADLAAAAARWHRAAGIPFVAAGRHPQGTHNSLGVLADQDLYVELISTYDVTSTDPWAVLTRTRPGPLAWAIGTDDIERDVARLADCGVVAGPVLDGIRRCPDGTHVTWRAAQVGAPGESPWPFLISWPRPGAERLGVPAARLDIRITSLTAAVPDPERAGTVFRDALGFRPVPGNDDAVTDGTVAVRFRPWDAPNTAVVALGLTGAGTDDVTVDDVHISRTAAVVVA